LTIEIDEASPGQLRYNCTGLHGNQRVIEQRKQQNLIQVWLMAYCATLALLAGCQAEGAAGHYDKYLGRLGRTLSVDIPAIALNPPSRPPRPEQLRLDIRSESLDTLDFLALAGCEVQVTIGKRNSSLGRMARDSQRLLLALEYLQLAPECIDYQRAGNREELADILQQAWDLKRQQLPALLFNATLGGIEYRNFWRVPANPGDYPAGTSSQVIASLQAVNGHARRWLAGDYQAHNRDFEILLSDIASGDGGTLLQALAAQGAWLSAADVMLAQRGARGPLCPPGFEPAAAGILQNVVRKYFVGETQPYAAALGRRYHELLPAITELEKLLRSAIPPDYRTWQQQRNTRLAELLAAPRRHVEQLKALQQSCPGAALAPAET